MHESTFKRLVNGVDAETVASTLGDSNGSCSKRYRNWSELNTLHELFTEVFAPYATEHGSIFATLMPLRWLDKAAQ